MTDSDKFTDAYLPRSLPGREEHLRQIRNHISPVAACRQPAHLWIYGPSGSGKTACVVSALQETGRANRHLRWIILNCWIDNTLYLLADRMSREWRILDGHGITTVSKLWAIKKFLMDKPAIIVLDEVDKLAPKERNKVLYNLAALGRVSLICISNSTESAWELEERIHSRLSLAKMNFEAYSAPEVMRILFTRSEGMHCPEDAVERVAQLSGGDMRVALRLLKSATHIAEQEKCTLSKRHVEAAFKGKEKPEAWRLSKMSEHERIIYSLIESNGGIRSDDLWKAYKELCKQRNIEAIGERACHKSLHKLKNAGLIRWTWIRAFGPKRAFWTQSAQADGETG